MWPLCQSTSSCAGVHGPRAAPLALLYMYDSADIVANCGAPREFPAAAATAGRQLRHATFDRSRRALLAPLKACSRPPQRTALASAAACSRPYFRRRGRCRPTAPTSRRRRRSSAGGRCSPTPRSCAASGGRPPATIAAAAARTRSKFGAPTATVQLARASSPRASSASSRRAPCSAAAATPRAASPSSSSATARPPCTARRSPRCEATRWRGCWRRFASSARSPRCAPAPSAS